MVDVGRCIFCKYIICITNIYMVTYTWIFVQAVINARSCSVHFFSPNGDFPPGVVFSARLLFSLIFPTWSCMIRVRVVPPEYRVFPPEYWAFPPELSKDSKMEHHPHHREIRPKEEKCPQAIIMPERQKGRFSDSDWNYSPKEGAGMLIYVIFDYICHFLVLDEHLPGHSSAMGDCGCTFHCGKSSRNQQVSWMVQRLSLNLLFC